MAKAKTTQENFEKPEDTKHETLVQFCIDLYDEYKKSTYRAKVLQEVTEARKTYEQKPDKKTFPWADASNIILPFETISVDNLEPRLLAGLVGRDPVVQFVEPDAKKDEPTEILEDWFDDELRNNIKIEGVGRSVVHTILLEGTRFSIEQYMTRDIVRLQYQFDEQTGALIPGEDGAPIKEEITDPAFEGVKDQVVPINKVFIPDDIGTIEEWEESDRIREVEYTYSELLSKDPEDGWMNIGPWLLPDKTKKHIQEKDKTPSQIVAGVDITGKETIPCLECHITYPMNDLDEEKPKELPDFTMEKVVITIVPGAKLLINKRLLRDLNMNNESIFKRVRLFPEDGRSYGSPIHSKLKGIQEGGSDIFNLVMNIATVVMIPWYFYEEGAGIKGKHEIHPGKGIPATDTSKILFPKFNINPQQFIEFINTFIQLWERTISLSEPQIGKQTSEQTTATEVLAVIQEGNIKHNYQATTFKEEFLSIIRTMYDLYYQYMPYDKMIERNDQQIPFPRGFMRRPYNFRLTGSTEQSNKLIERKENEDLFNMTVNDPYINQLQIREDLLKSYGRTNTDDYINPELNDLMQLYQQFPEEVQQLLQPLIEQLQAAQAGEGQGEQGGTPTQ